LHHGRIKAFFIMIKIICSIGIVAVAFYFFQWPQEWRTIARLLADTQT
jgi:hypothetical protein